MKQSEVDKFFVVLSRRWLAVIIVWAIGLLLMPFVAKSVPAYKGAAELLIVSPALKDTTLADPDLPSIVTSTEVLDRVIRRLNLNTDPLALSKRIKTKLPAKSSILQLTYRDTDRLRAAAVTNAVADESATYFREVSTRGYANVLEALDERIKESRAKIAASDRLLQRASAKNAFASSDKALDDLTSQINEVESQRGQVNASLAADQASALALTSQLRNIGQIVRAEILEKDVVYQQLQAQLAKDVSDLISERASFRESFPGLAALVKRVDRERAQLKLVEADTVKSGSGSSASFTQTVLDGQHAVGQVAADRERLRTIDEQLASEQNHLEQVAGAGATVGTLRAQRDAALQQYLALSERVSTAQGDAAQAASLGTLVVISRAIPGPSSITVWLLAIGALCLVFSIGAAFALDLLDRRLWGAREVQRIYERPILLDLGYSGDH